MRRKKTAKGKTQGGDKIIMMGGDNYRIGMGGGAVSSVATGEFGNAIEVNAINVPTLEMQKGDERHTCHGGDEGQPHHIYPRPWCRGIP